MGSGSGFDNTHSGSRTPSSLAFFLHIYIHQHMGEFCAGAVAVVVRVRSLLTIRRPALSVLNFKMSSDCDLWRTIMARTQSEEKEAQLFKLECRA